MALDIDKDHQEDRVTISNVCATLTTTLPKVVRLTENGQAWWKTTEYRLSELRWLWREHRGSTTRNNEASAKLTTTNGGTFTWAQLDSVANHVAARSIADWRALTWLATATGWTRRKRSAICSGKLVSVSTWFDTTWMGGMASRLYKMYKPVVVSTNNKKDRK